MKLNNKGFAVSSIMYLILVMAIILISITQTLLGNRKLVLDKIKNNAKNEIYSLGDEKIPEEYQRVDYIASTGTQYIDTGVIGKSGLSSKIKFMLINTYDDDTVLGSRAGSNRLYLLHLYNGFTLGYGNYYSAGTSGPVNQNIIYDVQTDLSTGTQTLEANGIRVLTTTNTTTLNTNLKLYLFALNLDGVANYFSSARIYELKIYDDNKLIRNMIPCYRKSDGVIGMYDTESKTFFTNKGTGTFLIGNEIIPKEYQEVEYLQASAGQVINTGYYSTPKTDSVEIKFQYMDSTNSMLITSGSTNGTYEWWYNYTSTNKFTIYAALNNNQSGVVAFSPRDTAVHTIKRDKGVIYNVAAKTSTGMIPATSLPDKYSYPLYLYGVLDGGYPANAKVYYVQIISAEGNVHKLVPCYRKSDNEPGFYDTYDGKFLTDALGKSTKLLKGADINR